MSTFQTLGMLKSCLLLSIDYKNKNAARIILNQFENITNIQHHHNHQWFQLHIQTNWNGECDLHVTWILLSKSIDTSVHLCYCGSGVISLLKYCGESFCRRKYFLCETFRLYLPISCVATSLNLLSFEPFAGTFLCVKCTSHTTSISN